MKKLLLIVLLLACAIPTLAQTEGIRGLDYRIYYKKGVKDGWYQATVSYDNSNTFTRSKYTLKVEVKGNRVVTIDFGNGGSVHSGYNNSGYSYYGGWLEYRYDHQDTIVEAVTSVKVLTQSATLTYDVSLD